MAERKKVKQISYEINNIWDLEDNLASLAALFTSLVERYGEDACLKHEYVDYETHEFCIESWRPETDAEMEKRLAKEKKQAEKKKLLKELKAAKAKNELAEKEAADRKMYEQLKKKFEGK